MSKIQEIKKMAIRAVIDEIRDTTETNFHYLTGRDDGAARLQIIEAMDDIIRKSQAVREAIF